MEKEFFKDDEKALGSENQYSGAQEGRQEIAERSDSLLQNSELNPPEKKGVESKTLSPDGNAEEETAKLEGRVVDLERHLEQAEAARREGEERLSATRKSLAEAISRYRGLLLESTPEVPESMVVGETVDEVDRSFAEASALVQQVRRDVEEKLTKERLPAGSPARGAANFAALTPMEKIRSALSN